ncbi:NUDIX domain-containing protein [Marinospirillum perlucidum]|uniref:NUDIX domain-containing protein n=1 Tax=Marinospirillum perlucidum TaxID=1982602 RepID=UPI001FE25BE1|nr:NUDIX domain-containing protein [Marinospirillum perlucidum]
MTSTDQQDKDYQILENKPVFQGFFSMHRLRLKHRRFAGDWTPVMSRELLYRGQAVGVLAYDPHLDQVVLVEQFRVGALESDNPWLIEVIAGLVEEGEEPQEVAVREAQEEAGLTLTGLRHLYTYYSSPGGTDEQVLLFCGLVDSSQAGGVHGLVEENEDIRVRVLAREDAFSEACRGQAGNAMTLIALQWLQSHYHKIREEASA